MAQELIPSGSIQNTESVAFRINKEDIPAAIQIGNGGGSDSATLRRTYDGTSFEDYVVDSVTQAVTEGVTNALAIDTVGIYKVKLTTAGGAEVWLSKGRDL